MRLVVKIPHKGKDKMVGKLFEYGDGHAFVHEASGDQSHDNTGAPCGIDYALWEWLKRVEALGPVQIWFVQRDKGGETYITTPKGLDGAPIQRTAGRLRIYLPAVMWDYAPKLPATPPWIPKANTIVLPDLLAVEGKATS